MKGGVKDMVFKVFIRRKMVADKEDDIIGLEEGALIRGELSSSQVLAVVILNSDFTLTVTRIKRLERFFASVFEERVEVIY